MSRPNISPNQREVLYVKDTATGRAVPVTSTLGLLDVSSGGGGGGGAVTVADGADVTQGAVADVAVTAGSTGTVSGKLRTISSDLATIKTTGIPITGTVAATQSGTWTVQPGNTANTTAWKVDGSAVTQPVSYATTGSGTATGALRVEVANNGTGILATVGAVTAITNALPAGTNAIGKLAANSGVDIGDVDVTTVGTITPGTAATSLGKAEDAGHTTGDVGVMDLGVRNDTLADQTNTNADYGAKSVDIKGRVMTAGAPRALKGMAQVQLSNTTTETSILAATASTFHDVYGIILANTGATTTKVSIRDDTAGTVRMILEVPTLETRGFILPVDSAIPQTATNKAWTAQCGSATTALEVTLLYVSMV